MECGSGGLQSPRATYFSMVANIDKPYMGISEVAEYCGVSRQVASNWRVRGHLPEPFANLAMGPVWKSADIIAWWKNRLRHPIMKKEKQIARLQNEVEKMKKNLDNA
jgi:predicted DNA-binding transcriptional regulator AlpA